MKCENCKHEVKKIGADWYHVKRVRHEEPSYTQQFWKRTMKDICRKPVVTEKAKMGRI